MKKVILSVLVFLMAANSVIFADDDYNEYGKKDLPKNTVLIDAGLTVTSFVISAYLDALGVDYFMLGTAFQYERIITNYFGLAARFEIIGIPSTSGSGNLFTFSGEIHPRYYPGGSVFYLSWIIGYAGFNIADEDKSYYSNYLKTGPKIGWRINTGRNRPGFTLEPSITYAYPFGTTSRRTYSEDEEADEALGSLDDMLVKLYLIGGLRFSLGLGYSF